MKLVLASVLGLVAAVPVAAQNECLKDYRMPEVGRWAEYTGHLNKKDPVTLRYAVVGTEEREGKTMKWLEMRMSGEQKDRNMVYQMLTPGNPAEMDQVQEMVFKPGDKPAMKMNGMMMKMIRGQLGKNSALTNLCEGVNLAGEESVTVPAGTFKALRFHSDKDGTDTWIVPTLPFYMVKSKGKDFEFNLASSGDGAESSISETPQTMGAPGR
jgi:hypothetical protein